MYALSTAAVIADSDVKGGTWSGALENQKHHWTQAFVRLPDDAPLGNHRLAEHGLEPIEGSATEWAKAVRDWLTRPGQNVAPLPDLLSSSSAVVVEAQALPDNPLFTIFLEQLSNWLSQTPKTEAEIAECFDLDRAQARRWLDRASAEGLLEKLDATSCYVVPPQVH